MPECEFLTLAELANREGWEDEPPENCADIQFAICHQDCPRRAAAIERGKELAEKHGWT